MAARLRVLRAGVAIFSFFPERGKDGRRELFLKGRGAEQDAKRAALHLRDVRAAGWGEDFPIARLPIAPLSKPVRVFVS